MSEIIRCSICRQEYELISAINDEEEIVSQTRCGCYKRLTKEKLDKAIEEVARRFNIKLRGVKNEKSLSKNQRYSKASKICSQGRNG